MMQIAIVGAGFAGLATAFYFSQKTNAKISVYDSFEIEGASKIASGLLHPFAGAQCRKTKYADIGMQKTKELLLLAKEVLGKDVAHYSGILRPAITQKQIHDFEIAAKKYPEIFWWNLEKCKNEVPYIQASSALFIENGITVYTLDYLQGLKEVCLSRGIDFFEDHITSLDQLKDFDQVVIAAGALTTKIKGLEKLPLFGIKGQVIELEWPTELPPLPCSLVSNGYITMDPSGLSCFVGSTYERTAIDAEKELRQKAEGMIPSLKEAKKLSMKGGVRMFSPDNLTPVVGQVNSKTWVLTALGSKGLLYHAHMADLITDAIIQNKPDLIPHELSYRLTF